MAPPKYLAIFLSLTSVNRSYLRGIGVNFFAHPAPRKTPVFMIGFFRGVCIKFFRPGPL